MIYTAVSQFKFQAPRNRVSNIFCEFKPCSLWDTATHISGNNKYGLKISHPVPRLIKKNPLQHHHFLSSTALRKACQQPLVSRARWNTPLLLQLWPWSSMLQSMCVTDVPQHHKQRSKQTHAQKWLKCPLRVISLKKKKKTEIGKQIDRETEAERESSSRGRDKCIKGLPVFRAGEGRSLQTSFTKAFAQLTGCLRELTLLLASLQLFQRCLWKTD